MLHSIDSEILFLKQEDVIKAGLLDMKQIIEVTEKTYSMLGKGQIKNPPKTNTSIPDKENWQSFFNSMPCYIGGDVNIGGIKWAAESKKNAHTPGIPYGIDITILSDPETVLPFCILDGTLVTAMRTSAVGGLLAKYTAPSNTETACLVGAGVIGRTMVMAIAEAIPTVKTMVSVRSGCTQGGGRGRRAAAQVSQCEDHPHQGQQGRGAEVPAYRDGDHGGKALCGQELADPRLRSGVHGLQRS